MAHNYYLYYDPETLQLTWIPWDNNEAVQEGKMGGALKLDFSNLEANNWPLIYKIYSDETYKKIYDSYLSEVINNSFETNKMLALYDT
jgi:spore coat protein H